MSLPQDFKAAAARNPTSRPSTAKQASAPRKQRQQAVAISTHRKNLVRRQRVLRTVSEKENGTPRQSSIAKNAISLAEQTDSVLDRKSVIDTGANHSFGPSAIAERLGMSQTYRYKHQPPLCL